MVTSGYSTLTPFETYPTTHFSVSTTTATSDTLNILVSGTYLITCTGQMIQLAAGAHAQTFLRQNGTQFASMVGYLASTGLYVQESITTLKYLAAGDKVTITMQNCNWAFGSSHQSNTLTLLKIA
jgi:hypothetical protein